MKWLTMADWELEKSVDEVDELLAEAFYTTGLDRDDNDKLRCYSMLKILLESLGDFHPGMEMKEVSSQMKKFIGQEKYNRIEKISSQIANSFFQIVEPTYTAASYWSPRDNRRHTISQRRRLGSNEEVRKMLAYTYAFYALTFAGRRDDKYFSATQYTAEKAGSKKGVRVCYLPEALDNNPYEWWHIPRGENDSNHARILEETGLTDAVEKYLLTADLTELDFRKALRSFFINKDESSLIFLNSFPSEFLESFPEAALQISEATQNEVNKTRKYVNTLFNAEPPLTDKQALFMLMTNLIYDVAFRSNFFYAFPVRIEGFCSVMTVGTNDEQPLKPFQHSAISRFVTSIFMHPLLLDYATEQARLKLKEDKEEFQLNVAQATAHAFKNLTKDIPVIGNNLLVEFNDLSDTALNSLDEESEIVTKISDLEKDLSRLSSISSFITAISLAIHRLASLSASDKGKIPFRDDPGCQLFRAVTLVALDMWKAARKDWEIEQHDLEESLTVIEDVYGERNLEKLALNTDFALLLFILNEPLGNIRNPESPGERVRIRIEVRGQSLFLCQETFEAEPENSIQSESVKKINRIIESIEGLSEKFIRISEDVVTVECSLQDDGYSRVRRETEIEVLKIPLLGSYESKKG